MTALLIPAVSRREAVSGSRSPGIDRLRGVAVLVMVADHVLVFVPGVMPVRLTVTRLAMPLFFVIAGHLATRCRWDRLLWVGGVGAAIPLVAWWIDRPNVLLVYAAAVPLVVLARRRPSPVWLAVLVAVPLVQLANGELLRPVTTGFDPLALLGLMALGALLPRPAFTAFDRLPAWLGWCGRWPLTVYVAHVVAFSAVAVLVGAHVR